MAGEPTTWIGIAALAVTNAGLLVDRFFFSRRNNGQNGKNKKLCEDHTKAILALEIHRTEADKKIDEWRKENREDHQQINKKLDGLSK
jgi:hypothetical protein